METLADYSPGLITQLYDDKGQAFHGYFKESRFLLEENEIPERVRHAILAMEDSNYMEHSGVDLRGTLRAAVSNLGKERSSWVGGSTITMQLARMVFLSPEKKWRRKIREAFLAVDLEKRFSKEQIFTLYCNLVNFGHGNYGVEAAGRYYFNKSASELSLAEAATLVAIIPRPSVWSPYRMPDFIRERRNAVLKRMLEEQYITEDEFEEASAEPLLLVQNRRRQDLGPYFAEEVRRYLYKSYGEKGLYERGLQVATTLDPAAQRAAEQALRNGLVAIDQRFGYRGANTQLDTDELEAHELPSWSSLNFVPGQWAEGIVLDVGRKVAKVKIADTTYELGAQGIAWTRKEQPDQLLSRGDVAWFRQRRDEESEETFLELVQEPEIEGAVVLLESATGAVRAMVGGWDFDRNEFNRATQAKRQVGSAFKAFVFGAALEMGYTPADTLFDAPCVFAGQGNQMTYSPRNFYRRYNGILTLRHALEKSINVTSVKLQDLIGVEQVVDFARRTGIQSPLPPYPSLALGAAELSPIELAASYAAIANQGIYVKPYLIESIKTPDGRSLETHQPQAAKAIEPDIAYVLTHMLEGVIDHGTGVRVRHLDVDLAGKTGTTDGYTDAWFTGYSPTHTLVVWVGHDIKRTIGRNMTGAEAALPIWKEVFERGLQEGWIPAGVRFSVPPGVTLRRIEPNTGLRPGPGMTSSIVEAFIAGTEPVQEYDPHWAQVMALPWYQQRVFYGVPKEGENMPEDIEDWSLVVEAREASE